MEEKVELSIIALAKSQTSDNNYVVALEDEQSKKRLIILIGQAEAQYIGIVLEKLNTKRPMTHDLLAATIEKLGGRVAYIYIHSLTDNIYIADICLTDREGNMFCMDARASDALAQAVKNSVPIYTNQQLLNDSSYLNEIYVKESNKTSFTDYTLEELEELLQKVLRKEDYESAIRIRETIRRKRKENL